MKLGIRLKKIASLVTQDYDHIWDCCCDHGLLGMSLLTQQPNSTVHCVDIVPELIQAIDKRLNEHSKQPPEKPFLGSWQTHCISTSDLPLESNPGKHLIIIAGVGGDLMINFIETINARHPLMKIDFILCPVHHLYNVRTTLQALDFKLKHEKLAKENHRFYEIIYASNKANSHKQQDNISAVGQQIWHNQDQSNHCDALEYVSKTLDHYHRIARGNNDDTIKHIIEAYSLIKKSYQ